jgi:hypothetical protein
MWVLALFFVSWGQLVA